MDDQGFDSRKGQESYLFSKTSRLAMGPTQPYIQLATEAIPQE